MKVTANGKTFTFPDGTSTEDIGSAIDEYFAGRSVTGQANAGQNYANNVSQLYQQQAAASAANANRPSGLQSALGGAMSGAASGAMIGSVVPGIGTAVGAIGGGIIGGLGSLF